MGHRIAVVLLSASSTSARFRAQTVAADKAVEVALILAGSYSYWRAAGALARSSDRGARVAYAASGLLLNSGLVTLTLNVLGY
jgi:hypothetical protein